MKDFRTTGQQYWWGKTEVHARRKTRSNCQISTRIPKLYALELNPIRRREKPVSNRLWHATGKVPSYVSVLWV